MRVIIAGSRDFNNYELLKRECYRILNQFRIPKSEIEIISGTARGADRLGEKFAKEHGLKLKQFPADWEGLGKKAGYIRNEQMAIYAKDDNGVLIAFWNGESRGTKWMIELAKKYGLKVYLISFGG